MAEAPKSAPTAGNPELVTLTIDGQTGARSPRAPTCSRRRARSARHQRLLLPPGPVVAGGVPPVPGRGQEEAQARAELLQPVAESMDVVTEREGRDGARADARVHAGQPPDRLPDLRQGRRVHAAEAVPRWTTRRRASTRQGPQGQGRRPRAGHRARRRALHPVHALHPRLRRGRAGAPARDGLPRRSRAADDRAGRAARQPVLAQHRRRLPGRRAHGEGLPLHDARLGARHDAVGVQRLRDRLQHRDPPRERARLSPRAAREPGRSTSTGCATRAASPTTKFAQRRVAARALGGRAGVDGQGGRLRRRAARRLETRAPAARSASCSTRRRPTRTTTRSQGRQGAGRRTHSISPAGRRGRSAPTTSCARPTSTRTPPARASSAARAAKGTQQLNADIVVGRAARACGSSATTWRSTTQAQAALAQARRRLPVAARQLLQRARCTCSCRRPRGPKCTARSPTARAWCSACTPPSSRRARRGRMASSSRSSRKRLGVDARLRRRARRCSTR